MFQCPACRQHISDSQIHDHIQNCEFYYQHSSHSISYSSMHSSFDGSYNYNRNSATSSESESQEEPLPDFSVRHKHMTPSKTQSVAVCPVCFEHFHNTRHAPLLLPSCGHTVCKPCIKVIRDKTEWLSCPICRAMIKVEVKHLPINYALLEITDKSTPSKCLVHDLELVAYCKDDEEVLCGACVFEHKDHCCCLLTDPILNSLAEAKKLQMVEHVEELLTIKKLWREKKQEMEIFTTKIRESIDEHKEKIFETEKKMIKDILEGSRLCILNLTEFSNQTIIKKVNADLDTKLKEIEEKITEVAYKVEKFNELSMVERLKNEFEENEKFKQVPNLGEIKKIHDRLRFKADYCIAILNSKFGL